jgi:hypothetical protein
MKNTKQGSAFVGLVTTAFVLLLIAGVAFVVIKGCSRTMVKSFGGSMTIKLEPNTKLVNVTWKNTELWLLTRDMASNEVPTTLKLTENSTLGVLEGQVVIKETR